MINDKLLETIEQILNDGGHIRDVRFVHSKNKPPEAKYIFKKLTPKEITFFQKQLVLLKNTDNSV